jgi:hypothetical protein
VAGHFVQAKVNSFSVLTTKRLTFPAGLKLARQFGQLLLFLVQSWMQGLQLILSHLLHSTMSYYTTDRQIEQVKNESNGWLQAYSGESPST